MTGIERKLQQELEEQEYLSGLRDLAALQAWKIYLAQASDTTPESISKITDKAFTAANMFMIARDRWQTISLTKTTEAEHVEF